MPDEQNSYTQVSADYFAKRGLRRYAGVASLWALGVGAVISGHYSGWNLGLLAGGWGGFALAALVIAVMYLGLVFCIAEMGAALPHTGGAYSFARASMGPWGGFITGLCENVEYVLTPAVVVSFLATYLAAVFDTPTAWLPAYWVAGYAVFVGLNVWGVELSFRVTVVVTLAALACLAVFWISALPVAEFERFALNIGAGPDGTAIELPQGDGPLLPFGITGAFAALPFAVWLFLAIEQLPLAAEESMDPSRDMPRGIIAGLLTLFVSAGLILWLNPSVAPGSFKLGISGEPLLDGFRATFGDGLAKTLALVACIGLIASFHTILFAKGRQIYSLSRAGYFPRFLSITHPRHKTPYVALLAGSAVALAIMFGLWFGMGAEKGAVISAAGRELHRAPDAAAPPRASLPLAARHPGRNRYPGHRHDHARLPARRPDVRHRRDLGRRVVHARHHLVRAGRPEPPGAGAGRGLRDRCVRVRLKRRPGPHDRALRANAQPACGSGRGRRRAAAPP
jgi:ethanolamine permease